jgi:geranylgeranyl diphosphate synthase type II
MVSAVRNEHLSACEQRTLSTVSIAAIQQYIEAARVEIDRELDRLLPPPGLFPPHIHQAMRYSVFAGGKRLRPILCLEAGRLMGGDDGVLVRLGSALELFHTYSLIHDDLPALDNDDLRRGKPTSHRAFGESTAILAGDALLTLAFEVLSTPGPPPEACKLRVIHELAHALGTDRGMIGGQVIDLEMAGRDADSRILDYIHSAKTGAFIRAAVRCGALYAQAREEDLARLTTYSEKIGLAFQIVDDLLDVLGTEESLGKTVGKDDRQHKATYPAVHGIEASQRMATQLADEACEVLDPYGERARILQGIAQYMTVRKN